jgi:hypothetical protein
MALVLLKELHSLQKHVLTVVSLGILSICFIGWYAGLYPFGRKRGKHAPPEVPYYLPFGFDVLYDLMTVYLAN